MPGSIWENLIGRVVEDRYRLRALIGSSRDQAEFLADPVAAEASPPVTVTMVALPPEDFDEQCEKLHRARQLQHPNLLEIVAGGHLALEGADVLYLAAEPAARTLAGRLKEKPLSPAEARELVFDVAAALSFLHGQGLVYRHLGPETTVYAGGRWKLADFGGLEPASRAVPPAGDVRALGAMLRDALGGDPPAPFDAVVRVCLGGRFTLEQVLAILESPPKPPRTARWPPLAIAGALVVVALVILLVRRSIQADPPAQQAPITAPASAPSPPGPPGIEQHRPSAMPRPEPQPPASAAPPDTAPAQSEPTPSAADGAGPEEGTADYSSPQMDGRPTASGEPFDSNSLTAASRRYRLGTRLRVTNLKNGKSVEVRVNDRGSGGRLVRLTPRAARELGFASAGSARVRVEELK